jgi:hypothetical protein
MRTWVVLIALVVAGCGGGTAAAPTVTAPEPSVSTATATGQAPTTTADGPTLTFPATTASEVLALAGQRPAGIAAYSVEIAGSTTTPAVSYTVEIATDGARARIHQLQEQGQTWIGLDLASNTVTFVCTAPAGQTLVCHDGDPDTEGARAAERISRVLGNDFVTGVFAPLAAETTGVFVGNDNQAGVPVSCVASDTVGRLCVSRSGFITEISAAGVRALAQRVSTDVTPADLDRPSQP